VNDILQRRLSTRVRTKAIPLAAATLAAPTILRKSVAAQDQTTVRLTGWTSSPAEQTLFNQVLIDFETANPSIHVQYEPIPSDYPTKLQTDMAAGTVADVFYVDSSLAPDLMAAGQLMSLDDNMAASGVSAEDFFPGLIRAFQWNGITYGLPKDFSTLATVYDNAVFSDAGVTAAPTTWDELRSAAQTVLDSTGAPGIVIPADFARELAFHFAAGGEVFSEDGSKIVIDSPEGATALDFYYGLYRDGLATTPADAGASWPGEALSKNLGSIVFEGNWVFPFLQENAPDLKFGIAELPQGPAGKANLAFTVSFSIFADTQVPDEAWTLVNYLTGEEGMGKWVSLGLAMPSRVALADAWSQQFPERAPFLAAGDYSRGWQLGVGGNAFLNDANAELQGLFAGEQDVATTLAAMQKAAEERIDLSAGGAGGATTPEATPTT
jgi:multiple sugar transport system substrate-binding protein